jgi:cytohesin
VLHSLPAQHSVKMPRGQVPMTALAEQLRAAASSGRTAEVARLLAHRRGRAAVNLVSSAAGQTALHLAAAEGHHEIARSLIAAGADVHLLSAGGHSPLCMAVAGGHAAVVRHLLAAGADPGCLSQPLCPTPLYLAAMRGDSDIMAQLLAAGADPNCADSSGVTPLMIASQFGRAEAARLLLAAGADVNARALIGGTALQGAVRQGAPEVVGLLLAAGADANQSDGSAGLKVLHTAAGPDSLSSAAGPLAEHRPDNARQAGVNFRSCIDLAASSASPSSPVDRAAVVRQLVAAGADLEARTDGGNTPLHCAAFWGQAAAVEALLEAGADPRVLDGIGHCPRQHAIVGGHTGIAQMLQQAQLGAVSGSDGPSKRQPSFRPEAAGPATPLPAAAVNPAAAGAATPAPAASDSQRPPHVCAACGQEGLRLQKCSRCKAVRYCG